MMERSPSLSSSQEASPVLTTIADMAKNQESGQADSGSKNLIASLSKVIRRRSPGKNDEFWESLQSHYNYLMDKELIEACKEANGELSWDDTDLGTGCTWTFNEFMDKYKQILEWMDKMQKNITVAEDQGHLDGDSRKCFIDDVEEHILFHKIINEQSERLILRYPDLESEINCHITHMNHRWERIQNWIAEMQITKEVLKDVEAEIRCLRKWLRVVESQLQSFAVCPGWTLKDVEQKLMEHQRLQKEIESRGKNVLQVIRLCDHVQAAESASSDEAIQQIHRIALNLERRWHSAWLRSLEWQCLLEELISKAKSGTSFEEQLDSSFGDEPLTKFPRLAGEWTGRTSWSPNENENEPLDIEYLAACSPLPDSDLEDPVNCEEMETDADVRIENDDTKTRDVGTDYENTILPGTNEKGIMVGTTGITELKADCDGDYKNFEIIQDVGYSSESSTQLSNDERGGDVIPSYSYNVGTATHLKNTLEEMTGENAMKQQIDDIVPLYNNGSDSSDNKENCEGIVDRAGPNCATFYFRHIDTDSEYKMDDGASDVSQICNQTSDEKNDRRIKSNESPSGNMHSPSFMRRRQWSDTMLSTKPSSARMDVEFLTDVESPQSSLSEEETRGSKCLTDAEKLSYLQKEKDDDKIKQPAVDDKNESNQAYKRESIQELVEQAERLVQEEKTPLRTRTVSQPLWLGEAWAKNSRLKEWLNSHRSVSSLRPAALPPETVIDSSCDASGEYTSNDSEDECSVSSEEQNNSVIMCHYSNLSDKGLETRTCVQEGPKATPTTDQPKVIMRNKKRNSRDRPWSVTELYQMTNRLDLTPFSISESALNKLLTAGEQTTNQVRDRSCSPEASPNAKSPSSTNIQQSNRKTKTKCRKRYNRRSDSGSDGHSRSSILQSGGSDGSSQKSPSRRWQLLHSKSHSSGSDTGKRLSDGKGGKSISHSSGTEQYSSEAAMADTVLRAEDSDSESEPTKVFKTVPKNHPSEELSSVSEQAWDDYQDSPYLSEPYSEKLIDDERMRRLMEFGDDYGQFFASHSDTASQSSYSGIYSNSNKRFRGLANRSQVRECKFERTDIESDSDFEDLRHILRESSNQLQFSQNLLKQAKRENRNSLDYVEFLATCHTNIKCLEKLDENLNSDKNWTVDVEGHIKESLVGWEMLKTRARDQQQEMVHLKKVHKEIIELRETMNNIDNSIASCGKQIDNKDILERMIQEVQAYLSSLQEKKTTLLTINLQVHSLLSGGHSDTGSLKAEVAALYYLWDQVFERSSNQLDALKGLKSTWTTYDEQYETLSGILDNDQQHLSSQQKLHIIETTSLTAENQVAFLPGVETKTAESGVVGKAEVLGDEQLQSRHVQLAALEDQAKQLESMLADTSAWDAISQQLNQASSKLCHLKEKCQELNSQPVAQEPLPEAPKRKKVHVSETERALKTSYRYTSPNGNDPIKSSGSSLLWRVMRAALPFQLAIVVLCCIACLMEPHCCDSINNFSLSFSPQLHYVRGPPPI